MAEKIPKKEKDENLPADEQRKSEKPLSKYQQKQMSVMKETMGGAPVVESSMHVLEEQQQQQAQIPTEIAPAAPKHRSIDENGIEDVVSREITRNPAASKSSESEVIELTPISPPKKSVEEIAAELEVRTREYNERPWDPEVSAAFEGAKKASEGHETESSNGNYYEALGLSPDASVEDIVGTLNRRAAEFNAKPWITHAQEDHDSDRKIAEVLLDDKKRAQYDKNLSEAAAARTAATVAEARHEALHNSMYDVEDVTSADETISVDIPDAEQDLATPTAPVGGEGKSPETTTVAVEEKIPTEPELLDKRIRRIFKYRRMGIGYDEITKNLEEIGEDPVLIAEALKQVKSREISRQWEAKNQLREELNEERTLSQAERKETADLRASLGQVETKPGLATEWQKDIAPPAKREKPLAVPADTRPLIKVETKIPDAAPVDEYMELIQNFMYKGQPIPPEVQAVYEDIQKSIASKDDVAKDVALEKLRGFVTKQQEVEHAETDTHIPVAHGESESAVIPVGDLKKERVFDENGAEYVDFKETVIDKEGTPKEWREKLRGLIDGAKEKLGMSELGEKMKGFLSKRSGELDVEAGKMGKGEKLFRTLGEKYNKLPMWQKVALGGSLAVGYGFTLPISSWLAGAYALPLFATRVAAMAGSFENNRKLFETINKGEAKGLLANTGLYKWLGSGSEKNRENKAMAKALIQSFGMTLGLSYVAHEIAEHHVAERIGQWMVEHMPSKAPGAPTGSREVIGKITEMPKVATTAVASEIPGIEVTATPGHGYEYMMKRLWEQLQEKHIELPKNANPDSDLAKLLAADKNSIHGIVHRLAQDNEFFKGDGTSAHINLDSTLTIDTKGQIWLDHENILAPEDAPVTPAYHAEAEAPHVSEVTEGKNLNIDDGTRQLAQEFVAPLKSATPLSETLTDAGSSGTIPDAQVVSVETHEASAPNEVSPANSESTVISNVHNVQIQTAEAHIYGDRLHPADRFVYGGGEEQQMKMINEYLNKVKDTSTTTVYAEDTNGHRVPWTLSEAGDLIKGPPVRYGFWQSFVESPNPQKFTKIIK